MNELEERIKRVALRRAWVNQKFGKCVGMGEGCEKGITRTDLRPLQLTWYIPGLGRTTSLDIFCGSSWGTKKTEKIPAKRTAGIKCRHCGGCHLSAKCLSSNGEDDHLTAPRLKNTSKETGPVQSYYLGPPPGIESNPLDFEDSDSEEHQLVPGAVAAISQSYAQENRPVEEVTAMLNRILNHNHKQRASASRNPSTYMYPSYYTTSGPPKKQYHHFTDRKWNNSRPAMEDYNKYHRLDFRKRKILPPNLEQRPMVLQSLE